MIKGQESNITTLSYISHQIKHIARNLHSSSQYLILPLDFTPEECSSTKPYVDVHPRKTPAKESDYLDPLPTLITLIYNFLALIPPGSPQPSGPWLHAASTQRHPSWVAGRSAGQTRGRQQTRAGQHGIRTWRSRLRWTCRSWRRVS